MATTKDVTRLPSGRLKYRGETFAGYNKPKRTPGKSKKSAVLAKKGSEVKLVRFGDPNMEIKKDQPGRRRNFRARHNCASAKDKFSARYWSCKAWSIVVTGGMVSLSFSFGDISHASVAIFSTLL